MNSFFIIDNRNYNKKKKWMIHLWWLKNKIFIMSKWSIAYVSSIFWLPFQYLGLLNKGRDNPKLRTCIYVALYIHKVTKKRLQLSKKSNNFIQLYVGNIITGLLGIFFQFRKKGFFLWSLLSFLPYPDHILVIANDLKIVS